MIRADINEDFTISTSLVDEQLGETVSGANVTYIVAYPDGTPLNPTISGSMEESIVSSGTYVATLHIPTPGNYVFYAKSSGYISDTEDIIINSESINELIKQNRHYNLSVEDVARTNLEATSSQTIRKVPYGKTDYIMTKIKSDSQEDWSNTTCSGKIYAWYNSLADDLPYKMGSSQ